MSPTAGIKETESSDRVLIDIARNGVGFAGYAGNFARSVQMPTLGS